MVRESPAAFDQHALQPVGDPSLLAASHVWSSKCDGRFRANALYEANGCGASRGRRSNWISDSTACIASNSSSVPSRKPTRRIVTPGTLRRPANDAMVELFGHLIDGAREGRVLHEELVDVRVVAIRLRLLERGLTVLSDHDERRKE